MMKTTTPVLLFVIAFFMSGCGSKELKKEEAVKIISAGYHLPLQTKIAIDESYSDYGWPPERYNRLATQGLITLKSLGGNFFSKDRYQVSITESGKKYWIQNGTMKTMNGSIRLLIFKGYTIELESVNVSSNAKDKTAQADVVFRKSNSSPMQDIFDPLKDVETKMSIQFKLFDNGWQITEIPSNQLPFDLISTPLHWMDSGEIYLN